MSPKVEKDSVTFVTGSLCLIKDLEIRIPLNVPVFSHRMLNLVKCWISYVEHEIFYH